MADIFVGADIILGASTIRQVTQSDHQTGLEMRKAMTSGGTDVAQVSGKSGAEMTSFTSGDLAALLALNSSEFIACGLSLLSSTITVPYKIRNPGGKFKAGSTHPQVTGSNAFVYPVSIEASTESDFASVQCETHWISADGDTKGADDAVDQALAAQSFNAEFILDDVYINGSLIPGAQSVRITTGIEVVKPPKGSGKIYPTQVSVKQVIPTIEITGNDFEAIEGTVGDFTAMTSANIYLKKRADAGVFVDDTTTEHVRVTFAAGLTDTNNITTSNNDDGTWTITLHGKTLTANAAVAIP